MMRNFVKCMSIVLISALFVVGSAHSQVLTRRQAAMARQLEEQSKRTRRRGELLSRQLEQTKRTLESVQAGTRERELFERELEQQKWNEHLLTSAKLGLPDSVNSALGKGANVNTQDDRGFTPLHYAALAGHVGTVNTLLEAGADVHATGAGEMTPFDFAQRKGHEDVALILRRAQSAQPEELPEERGFFEKLLEYMGLAEGLHE